MSSEPEPVLYAEPILAARVWQWGDDKLLHSVHNDMTWPTDAPAEARCVRRVEVMRWQVDVQQDMSRNEPVATLEVQLPLPVLVQGIAVQVVNQRLEVSALVTHTHEEPAPPHPEHQCGIYALAGTRALQEGLVHGVVQLWGRVIPASYGWRAQFARIVAVAHDEAAAVYGVPRIRGDWPQLTDPRQFRPRGEKRCDRCGGEFVVTRVHDELLYHCPNCEYPHGGNLP